MKLLKTLRKLKSNNYVQYTSIDERKNTIIDNCLQISLKTKPTPKYTLKTISEKVSKAGRSISEEKIFYRNFLWRILSSNKNLKKADDLKVSTWKNAEYLIIQSRTMPQETLGIDITKSLDIFLVYTLLELEERKWALGETSLEMINAVLIIMTHDKSFAIWQPRYGRNLETSKTLDDLIGQRMLYET